MLGVFVQRRTPPSIASLDLCSLNLMNVVFNTVNWRRSTKHSQSILSRKNIVYIGRCLCSLHQEATALSTMQCRKLGAEEAVRQAVETREAQVKEKAESLEQTEKRHK